MSCHNHIQITTLKQHGDEKVLRNVADALELHDLSGCEESHKPFGLYVHVPFCFHKCHYCDFYSIVDSQDRQETFTDRLIDEIHTACRILPESPATIFIGGGTPTLLKVPLWERVLDALAPCRRTADEFTVEANPETVTPELAEVLAAGGVNRVSIGAQSFNPAHLKTLERWHDPKNVARAVECFRQAGIERINLDLIFGIPGQTLDDWRDDLDIALSLAPSHLSCYALTYEPNTALTVRMQRGTITPLDEDVEATMYEVAMDTLAGNGFVHYEISAWARGEDEKCKHNLLYWTNANWWPIGPSAAGHWNGMRWKNVPRLGEYISSSGLPPIIDMERTTAEMRIGEELMLGLRLVEGVERGRLDRVLNLENGISARRQERIATIGRSVEQGLLEWTADRLRLTRRGLLLADSVLAELV